MHEPRLLHLAPEYRRCAIIVVAGGIVIVVTAYLLRAAGLVQNQNAGIPTLAVFFLLPPFALLAYVFSWKLEVSHVGISRRRLWHSDEWRWEEFTHGDARMGENQYEFVRHGGRVWDRKLQLAFAREQDRDALAAVLEKLVVHPLHCATPKETSRELTLKYRLFLQVQMDRDGFTLRHGRKQDFFAWSDVRRLWINRRHHGDARIVGFELEMPTRSEIILGIRSVSNESELLAWNRQSSEHVESFLRNRLTPDRVVVCAKFGPAHSYLEFERRQSELPCQIRTYGRVQAILIPCFFVLSAAAFGPKIGNIWAQRGLMAPWALIVSGLALVFLVTAYPCMVWGLCHHTRKTLSKELTHLGDWLTENEPTSEVAQDSPRSD